MDCEPQEVNSRLAEAERVWFFLDYDGTLAEFARTPDEILVDHELVELLSNLSRNPRYRLSVISGRRLGHVQALLPVPGTLIAGTYGVELQSFEGEIVPRLKLDAYRPTLDAIKPELEALISGKPGFYLEDKGWSLALHARFADEGEAERVIKNAQDILKTNQRLEDFQILGGNKFLEFCPKIGNKGETVQFLLNQYPWPGALLVYVGDDDKDEDAFQVIVQKGGIAIQVGPKRPGTVAQCRMASPSELRQWLRTYI